MKTSLSYLPQIKQEQILRVAEIIKSVINPEKIILYGSYAKVIQVEHSYLGRDDTEYAYDYINEGLEFCQYLNKESHIKINNRG